MHENPEVVTRFYDAFGRLDHETMAACYAPDATFSDPVFRDLDHDQATAMWRMFCVGSTDLKVKARDIHGSEGAASATWEATYTFTPTRRAVHNVIHASFHLQDGKIVRHEDSFDLYRWTRMALGPTGVVLGWTPMVQNKVRQTAHSQLRKFMEAESRST